MQRVDTLGFGAAYACDVPVSSLGAVLHSVVVGPVLALGFVVVRSYLQALRGPDSVPSMTVSVYESCLCLLRSTVSAMLAAYYFYSPILGGTE